MEDKGEIRVATEYSHDPPDQSGSISQREINNLFNHEKASTQEAGFPNQPNPHQQQQARPMSAYPGIRKGSHGNRNGVPEEQPSSQDRQTHKTHEELRPLSAEARQDLGFVFEEEGKQMVQGWRKLFYNTARLQDTSATKQMFFNKRSQGVLGSRCPLVGDCGLLHSQSQASNINVAARPMSATLPNKSEYAAASSSARKGIILLKPRVAINTYKMHQTLFNIARDEVQASSVLQELASIETKFNYGELCRIARATNPNELLRSVARSEPGGIAYLALQELNKRNSGGLPRPNSATIPARRSGRKLKAKTGRTMAGDNQQVIAEESEDVSLSNAKYYDAKDPDIVLVDRLMEGSARVRPPVQREAVVQEEENSDHSDEQYVKDADQDDDDAFKEFNKDNVAATTDSRRPGTARTIQSAHPLTLTKRLAGDGKKEGEVINPRFDRPTTVPAEIKEEEGLMSEKRKDGRRNKKAKQVRLRTMRMSQSAGPSAFRIVGRTAKLCSRSPTAVMKGKGKEELRRVVTSRTNLNPVAFGEVQIEALSAKGMAKLYATTTTTNGSTSMKSPPSMTIEEEPHPTFDSETLRTIHQINLVTDLQLDSSGRPGTAQPKPSLSRPAISTTSPFQERPLSAQVFPRGYLQRSVATTPYVPTNYMRPFSAHRRPVSAAINASASHDRVRTMHIDPEKTREKYLKYLQQLESGAKRFVIEEDTEPVPQANNAKHKSLLQQAKKQRKHVRLRKKRLGSGKKQELAKGLSVETLSSRTQSVKLLNNKIGCISITGCSVKRNGKEFIF